MFRFFKDTIKLTNENIILATPLIVFMWILSIYLNYSRNSISNIMILLLVIITVAFMSAAFFSGWFYMIKKSLKISKQIYVMDDDKTNATSDLVKTFPIGIGKYFLSFLGFILLFLLIVFIMGTAVFQTGIHLIGNLGLDPEQIKNILSSTADMQAFLNSLSFEQLIKLNNWNLLFIGATSITSFLLIFWIPEIIYKTKNPFIAIIQSIKKVFIKPFDTVKMFIFISILNFTLSFISTFSMQNPILYFIMMIIYFYFLVYIVVLIFSYYEKEFE